MPIFNKKINLSLSFFASSHLFCYFTLMYRFLKGRLIVVRLALLAAALALVAIGIAAIYSVGYPADYSPATQTEHFTNLWKKQLIFATIGAFGFIAANLVNYRRFGAASYWIYASVLLLLAVLLLDKIIDVPFVPVINNARRWLRIGTASRFVQIQPSEICKLAYILALAWYLRYRSNYSNFRALIGPFALTLLPMVLILLEPDLGTVLLMMPILFTMLFVAGAKVKHLATIIIMALLVSPLLWGQMRPYQRTRISSAGFAKKQPKAQRLQRFWSEGTKNSPLGKNSGKTTGATILFVQNSLLPRAASADTVFEKAPSSNTTFSPQDTTTSSSP
jgi:rod shape determining protein RodA